MRTVPCACVAVDERDRGQVGGERGPGAVLDLRDLAAEVVLDDELLAGRDADGRLARPRPARRAGRTRAGSRAGRAGSTPSIVRSPPVTAARPMKLPTSMCSGAIAPVAAARARSTPSMRSTFDSIPSIRAPSETRKRQRSWTCGSQAALPITVSPSASTAAMTAFSVAITLASSRKIGLPREPRRAHLVAAVDPISTPSSAKRVDVRVEPAPADHVAARRRHASRGRSARAAARRAGTRRGSGGRAPRRARTCATPTGVDADLVLAQPLGVGADVGEQLDHRLDVADARHVRQRAPARERAASRRGSAARRSCSRPRGRCR